MNIGDPIQSLAVINLYREMGVAEEDIIPVDRFDAMDYAGEECVMVFNGLESVETAVFNTPTLPPAPQIHPIYMGLHYSRKVNPGEIESFIRHGPVGCRDGLTVNTLTNLGVSAFLSGCLTVTYPLREKTDSQDKVFLVDVQESLIPFIPDSIKEEGISVSHIRHFASPAGENRISREEAVTFHKVSYEMIERYRSEARLVITSRLHCAAPCMAMGIPVILAHDSFDERFDFMSKFLPLYTPENYGDIDWTPRPVEMEKEKSLIKEYFFARVRSAALSVEIRDMYAGESRFEYRNEIDVAVGKIPFGSLTFRYTIWGVACWEAKLLKASLEKMYPESQFCCGIDTFVTGKYEDTDIVHPDNIGEMPEDIIVFSVMGARQAAKELLIDGTRPFVLVNGVNAEYYNFA